MGAASSAAAFMARLFMAFFMAFMAFIAFIAVPDLILEWLQLHSQHQLAAPQNEGAKQNNATNESRHSLVQLLRGARMVSILPHGGLHLIATCLFTGEDAKKKNANIM